MLLRLQAGFERCAFAELQKLAQFKSEFRQRGEQMIWGDLFQTSYIYRITIYIL